MPATAAGFHPGEVPVKPHAIVQNSNIAAMIIRASIISAIAGGAILSFAS